MSFHNCKSMGKIEAEMSDKLSQDNYTGENSCWWPFCVNKASFLRGKSKNGLCGNNLLM